MCLICSQVNICFLCGETTKLPLSLVCLSFFVVFYGPVFLAVSHFSTSHCSVSAFFPFSLFFFFVLLSSLPLFSSFLMLSLFSPFVHPFFSLSIYFLSFLCFLLYFFRPFSLHLFSQPLILLHFHLFVFVTFSSVSPHFLICSHFHFSSCLTYFPFFPSYFYFPNSTFLIFFLLLFFNFYLLSAISL